ncbi:DUF998 domain-containing protein [Pyrococcus yayanosii]|uniref:Uncharacterized protein n=1 Tax=Pyrococcus yayanosii (strain CH1 / JCM 16557) TaxID=529709 RepID=F8AFT6_PYRYC|nr:DUF998 domain-containing protein [Pyrococcus yayanosii]AEH23837.1 hypothetical protein PYCH_01280 [Pyrococcus yayanosii CH1]
MKPKVLAILFLMYFVVGLAIVLRQNPWFSFTENALSDMGSVKNPVGWMFNGFVMGLGVLGIITALALERKLLALSMAFLFLVGVFPEETEPHGPVAVLFYLLALTDMGLYGGIWRIISVATLLGMLVLMRVFDGLAIPELLGASSILSYILWLGMRK